MPAADRPRKPTARPLDYVAGRWPDGPIRLPDEETGEGEAERYVAEQVVRLIRDLINRREQRGLRRSQVAAMTGLRPNTLSDLENGQSWPDMRTLALIAWALEADLEFVPRQAQRRRNAGL